MEFLSTPFVGTKLGFVAAFLAHCGFLGHYLKRFLPLVNKAAMNVSFVAVS
jgi:hypothetical protein